MIHNIGTASRNEGQIVVFILVLLASSLGLSVAVFSLMGHNAIFVGIEINQERALQLAEAGVNRALFELNHNAAWAGVPETILGGGSYEVTVTGFGNSRLIESTGFVPAKANARFSRTVRAMFTDSPGAESFRYGVQSGTGGLVLNSHARINGNVFSNGSISCASGAIITGDGNSAGTISPTACVQGVARQGVPPQPLPLFDANYWINAVNRNPGPGCPTTGSVIFSGTASTLGPCRVNGSVTIDNHAHLTLTGPIYVTGNFYMRPHSQLSLAGNFGADGTVVLVDGTIFLGNHAVINRMSGGGHIMLVSRSTSTSAIELNSHTRGGVFYALNGTLVANSHSHPVALTGQRMVLNSHAEILFDQGLPDQSFTSGPGGRWVIHRGTWRIIVR